MIGELLDAPAEEIVAGELMDDPLRPDVPVGIAIDPQLLADGDYDTRPPGTVSSP